MTINKKIGRNMRGFRQYQGLSAKECGDVIGICKNRYLAYERGEHNWTVTHVFLMMKHFEVKLLDVFKYIAD